MVKNISKKSAFETAFHRWFSEYESERLFRKKRRGSKLVDFAPQPVSPLEIQNAVHEVGQRRVLEVFQVHRTTLKRWLNGDAVMPRCAWLLLVLLRDGLLPGMSEDWAAFRFDGDRLFIIGTRCSYSAREIQGWQYQTALIDALKRRIRSLELDNAQLLKLGDFGAANDALIAM